MSVGHWLVWSGKSTFDLDDDRQVVVLYETVLREATSAVDLARWLDGSTLVHLWPTLVLPPRRPGDPSAFWYFLPTPIPRTLPLDPATVLALSEADAAVGHLQGLGHLISDPQLLIGPYVSQEALASSRIEGTRASLAELLQAVADDSTPSEDVAEVERYIAATY